MADESIYALKALNIVREEYSDGFVVKSPILRSEWNDYKLSAKCQYHKHSPPFPGCVCGIYGKFKIPWTVAQSNAIVLARFYGKVLIYEEGIKAEHAEVVGILHEYPKLYTEYFYPFPRSIPHPVDVYGFAKFSGMNVIDTDDAIGIIELTKERIGNGDFWVQGSQAS